MKLLYKSSILAFALVALSSCAKHDLFDNQTEMGERLPTCYWEVTSTACKAGENFEFKGKYYTEDKHVPDHSEVWYKITRNETAEATVKLCGTTLKYSQSVANSDVVRANQSVVSFAHSLAEWDGREFVISGQVPTSSTLSPVTWVNVTTWDQFKFDGFYPQGFADEFKKTVVDYLTKDDTYYEALKYAYINYPFTNEQFAEANAAHGVNLPTDIQMKSDNGAGDKSDRWFTTTTAYEAGIVGYYYITLDEQGKKVYHEVAKDYEPIEGVNYYPVYKSCNWVFCRYDDDAGAIVSTVRPEYYPAFKQLLELISFEEWIYDTTNKSYAVNFTRNYVLEAEFHVYDTEGNEGIASDKREITIN